MKINTILSIVLFFFYPLPFACAGLAIDPDTQFEYANECFSNQEYFRAADEYSRFIFSFPEDERVEEARYQIGMSYFRAGQFQAAIDTCRKNIDGFQNSDFARKSYFLVSMSHMALDQPGDAIVNLNNLLLLTGEIDVQDQVHYALGWMYLELRWPLNHRPEPGVLEEARRHFKKISQQNWGTYRVEELLSDKTC